MSAAQPEHLGGLSLSFKPRRHLFYQSKCGLIGFTALEQLSVVPGSRYNIARSVLGQITAVTHLA